MGWWEWLGLHGGDEEAVGDVVGVFVKWVVIELKIALRVALWLKIVFGLEEVKVG